MTGAEKRAELLRLARGLDGGARALLGAAIVQIAGLDLDSRAVCERWANICEADGADANLERCTALLQVVRILEAQ